MTGFDARAQATTTVVDVVGALDARVVPVVRQRLEAAVAAALPVVVDLGDCTFVDGAGARLLAHAHGSSLRAGVPLTVVLPFSCASRVRRMLLEFAPDLVPLPIVARRIAAATSTEHPPVSEDAGQLRVRRMQELRAGLWAAGSRRDRLLAERDALILRQREALAVCRGRTAPREEPT
jgi:anti-anti-sigma factor